MKKPARRYPKPRDDYERGMLPRIRRWGWDLAFVLDDSGPPFVYTVGLLETWGHPELLIVGIDLSNAREALSKLVERIETGERFAHGDEIAHAAGSRRGLFVRMKKSVLSNWVSTAQWFYARKDVEVLQVVCTAGGKWPWESPALSKKQPLLGTRAKKTRVIYASDASKKR